MPNTPLHRFPGQDAHVLGLARDFEAFMAIIDHDLIRLYNDGSRGAFITSRGQALMHAAYRGGVGPALHAARYLSYLHGRR